MTARPVTPSGSTLQAFAYDGNGNLTGAVIGAGTWTYAYDPENHLINAKETAGGTINATYAYDPLGHRNAKTGSGGVVSNYYLDDGEDEITEYNSSGSATLRYIPGPAINEPIGSVAVSTGSHRFYQADHHGSLISVVSSSGTQVEGPFSYDAYGNSQAPSTTEYRYVGMRLDAETGLYYDRARYYSPVIGRFFQVDPVGYAVDPNLYTYVGDDPINRIDPSGNGDCGSTSPVSGCRITPRGSGLENSGSDSDSGQNQITIAQVLVEPGYPTPPISGNTSASPTSGQSVTDGLSALYGQMQRAITRYKTRNSDGSVNLDTNVLIHILDQPGSPAAVAALAAIGKRQPLISMQAQREYLIKGSPTKLAAFMAATHAEFAPAPNGIAMDALIERGLSWEDAYVVQSGIEAGARTMTRDKNILRKTPEFSETF